jgi:branched-chain amino acid transport system permease protein
MFKRLLATSATPAIFEANSMLASFGLLFIIRNLALIGWGSEMRGYSYLAFPVNIGGALFGANRLVTLGFALLIGISFYLFLARTRMGKAIRAAAQDPSTAGLLGVNIKLVLALCFGLGAAMAASAGMLISMSYPVHSVMGMEYTVIAIIVVVLGGLGNIPGSFMGGFILGLIGSVVTFFEPGLALAAYYIIFIFLLLLKPTGLMGK